MPMLDQIMLDTIDELILKIEQSVIPQENRTDFDNGDVAFSDFASYDEMNYYNSLIKQKIYVYGITAAIISSPEKKEIPIRPPVSDLGGGNVLDSLDTDEFVDQGYNNPVTELTQSYVYYDIQQGDTLKSIATDFYNDYRQWTRIAQANKLLESDLMDNDMVGEYIKVPVDQGAVLTRANDNLVYEANYDPSDVDSIKKFIFGIDINLTDGKITVDGYGDMRKTFGEDNVKQSVQNRLDNGLGTLNPLHIDWGIIQLDSNSEVPWVVNLENALRSFENQAQADPRVVSATIDRTKIKLAGETIRFDIEIRLLGGFQTAWKSEV